MSTATSKKLYPQHFRDQWLNDSRFEKWLSKVEEDDTRCYCNLCKRQLNARISDIERHLKTAKHRRREDPSSAQGQTKPELDKSSDNEKTEGSTSLSRVRHGTPHAVSTS